MKILPLIAWAPMPSFEIWVEAFMTPQLLHSACLQNQHHMDNAKVCHHLEQ
jgi:hypothetical protein